jgi:broad specificity phosphatase PhoE
VTRLVLIRHAQVEIDPASATHAWRLSAEGAQAARRLREHPDVRDAASVYSSPEPKAVATAHALADVRIVSLCHALRELDRTALGWVGSHAHYKAIVREILLNPEESVLGCEPASSALSRFEGEVSAICARHPGETVALVSHGIVLALYVSRVLRRPPDIALWESIRFPDVAVVDLGEQTVMRPFGSSELLLS